ncbi:MAG: EAL domain-containing protein [Gammaproteobacteria bacterium]|nr:EAL domain-containing protein [Gammaproteobacteria bacterium]
MDHLQIFQRINQISIAANDIDEFLASVLDEILNIFDCDRAWLLYPCDPAAPTWNVPMERTRPEWPGVYAEGSAIATDPDAAELFRQAIETKKVITHDVASDRVLPKLATEQFSIKAQMVLAVYPKSSKPWLLGIHHCAKAHVFSEEEQQIFGEISQSITTSLSNLIAIRALNESQKMLQLVLDSIPVRVFWKDTDSIYLGCNRLFAMDAGLDSPEQIIGKSDFDLAWTEQAELYRLDDRKVIQAGKPKLNYEEPQTSPDGTSLWLRTSKIPLTDLSGTVIGVMGTYEDITSMKQSQEKVDFLAYHDPLTRLPNRLLLNDRLKHSLQRAEREKTQVAVLFIDLDNFKNINDSLGHPTGDFLLQEVGERIKSLVRVDDTVARLGGDEFIVVMEEIGDAQDSTLLAKKLVSAFNQPFTAKGRELYLTLSIGISIYPSDGADSETLIRNADSAMYRAKAEGRNDYQFYTSALTTAAFERLTLENALRRALENDEFILHYQPQYSLDTGKLTGLEALIRWQHPDMGVIAPDKFIPLAEESGIIVAIGEWVLRTACNQMKSFLDSGYLVERISINISGVQFQRESIVDTIVGVLEETNLDPKSLELEITESVIMQETNKTVKILNEIRQQGITIAVDDFGTGYSSLSYLKRLPVNKLKVDRSFVRDIPRDLNDEAITRAVIALGQALNLKVIAEGVETEEQQIFLKSLGCNEAQGNLYSRPLPVEELAEILKKEKLQ